MATPALLTDEEDAAATPPPIDPADGITQSPDGADGGGTDLIGLLGNAVGGGSIGLQDLTPRQSHDAGTRALLSFGAGMLAHSGYSPTPASLGPALAAGIEAAQASRAQSEQDVYAATGQQSRLDLARAGLAQTGDIARGRLGLGQGQLDVARGQLTVAQQAQKLKLQQFQLQMQMFKARQDAAQKALGLLGAGGAPGGGTPGPGASLDSTDGIMQGLANPVLGKGLPAPDNDGTMADWKDPDVASKIAAEATSQGLDPRIALGVAWQESRGDPKIADGDSGAAHGVFQLHAGAATDAGGDPATRRELGNNIKLGVTYLKQQVDKFGPLGGIMAYNAGPETVAKAINGQGEIPASARQYAANVAGITLRAPPPGGARAPAAAPDAAAGGGDDGTTPAPYQIAGEPVGPPSAPAAAPSAVDQGAWDLPAAAAPGAAGAAPPRVPGPPVVVPGGATAPGRGAPAPTPTAPNLRDYPPLAGAAAAGVLAEAAKPDGDVSKPIMDAIGKAIEIHKTPVFRQLNPQEAQDRYGQAFRPTSAYFVDQFGNPKVIEQTPDPVRTAIAEKSLETLKTDYDEPAASARSRMAILDQLSALQPTIEKDQLTGQGGQLVQYLRPVEGVMRSLNLLGDKFTQSVGAQQGYESLATQLALQMRTPGMSRITQFELEQFLHSVPSLSASPEGRTIITQVLRNMAQRQVDTTSTANKVFQRDGSLFNLGDELDKLPPIVRSAPSRDAPPEQITTFARSLRDGEVYHDWNGNYRLNSKTPLPGQLPLYRKPQ